MKITRPVILLMCIAAVVALAGRPGTAEAAEAKKLSVLLIDGQNNHNWKGTTPGLKEMLVKSGRFTVEVLTSPPKRSPKEAWAKFKPDFTKYDVIFSNYNGDPWPDEVNKAFEKYMSAGGGLVIYHAANNAFPKWAEWNKMIALGWRNNKFGENVCMDDAGKIVRIPKGEGPGAGHGPQWAFELVNRAPDHPVMKGMPAKWTHVKDELYQGQRGPGLNMTFLVTAYADKKHRGTGMHEPMVFAVSYGKGRVLVNLLGHAAGQNKHIGFKTLTVRGTEWAATGKVTIPVPKEMGGSAAAPAAAGAVTLPKGKALDGFRGNTGDWQNVGEVFVAAGNPKALASKPGSGVLVNGPKGRTRNMATEMEHADVEAHIEFMVPKGSNSGVYFMGRYEIQVFDSWGVEKLKHGDCGGIYQRWDKGKGFEGHPPRVNASKEPGQWQTFDVIFRAPRFDKSGKKIAKARFVKVVHNGKVVHENVELSGPTRAAMFGDEKPTGLMMFQGDHGPVAYRNIHIKHVKLGEDR